MSSSSPQDHALIPTVFLIGVTGLLVFFAIPRPYRDPLPMTPTPLPTVIAVAAVEPTPDDHLTLMAFGLEEVPSSSVKAGSRLYSTTCTACHGSDAKGILGLGKPLIDSGFVNRLNDDELVAFLKVGRMSSDPENTTGVAMPAKGGNPSLTDDDLNAVVDYIRSLNGATVVNDVVGIPTPVPTTRPFEAINLNTFSTADTTTDATTAPATTAPDTSTLSEPTDASPAMTATPVTSYGYETQPQTTAEPSVLPAMEATPVTSYGYETQPETTAEPSALATPTTSYHYDTLPDATNMPPVYGYETGNSTSEP